MAAPSVWANWNNSSADQPLRPSREFWDQVNQMHQVDADLERSIHEYAWQDDPRRPGYDLARDIRTGSQWDDHPGVNKEHLSDEQVIFEHALGPNDR